METEAEALGRGQTIQGILSPEKGFELILRKVEIF